MPDTNLDSLKLGTGLPASQIGAQAETTVHFFVAGVQTTGNKKAAALMTRAGTITAVQAYLDTAPTGAAFVTDLRVNGTSIYTTTANRPTIAIAGNASTTTLPDTVAVAAGDRLSMDVVTIGSGTAGSDLYFAVTIKRALV